MVYIWDHNLYKDIKFKKRKKINLIFLKILTFKKFIKLIFNILPHTYVILSFIQLFYSFEHSQYSPMLGKNKEVLNPKYEKKL